METVQHGNSNEHETEIVSSINKAISLNILILDSQIKHVFYNNIR